MEQIIDVIIKYLTGQESAATILPVVLMCVIGMLLHDRKRLIDEIKRKDTKIEKIVDDFYQGNMTMTEAFNSLKLVLIEIKGRLR